LSVELRLVDKLMTYLIFNTFNDDHFILLCLKEIKILSFFPIQIMDGSEDRSKILKSITC